MSFWPREKRSTVEFRRSWAGLQTEPWDIKVILVELKDIDLPQEMQRVIAKQAEAERAARKDHSPGGGIPNVA
jgi:hypothetical protein